MIRLFQFIILFVPQIMLAQQIKYNLFTVDSCSGKLEHELLYEIIRGEEKFVISDTLGTIILPDTGTFHVRLYFPEIYALIADSLTVQLPEYKTYADTVTLRKITECMGGMHSSFKGFCDCGLKKISGYQVDYFPNGQKRIEGTFTDGYAIGKLTYYYPSGQIKEVRYYDENAKGIIRKTIFYNKYGQVIE